MKDADSAPDKTRRAAALSYPGEGAPRLLAKGEGDVARRIAAIAESHDVPIVQEERLTELLCALPLGDEIPPDLFVAVAEVLAFVYRLNERIDDRA